MHFSFYRGREYWRLPTSDDLFIREGGQGAGVDADKRAFKRLLEQVQ